MGGGEGEGRGRGGGSSRHDREAWSREKRYREKEKQIRISSRYEDDVDKFKVPRSLYHRTHQFKRFGEIWKIFFDLFKSVLTLE